MNQPVESTLSLGSKLSVFRASKLALLMALTSLSAPSFAQSGHSYTIVDTNQTECSSASSTMGSCVSEQGLGQDAQYQATCQAIPLMMMAR
ncbi:hypothetical protein JCM19240_2896 [Vibrio maritimus]|uniref:Uncharacterized protein n=1 Tax=Vibrio maritimus TaxID=990268 RepID=A0A090U1D2_9VIBR|nr:hypothetical protein JCM19240_2896 [Vibrio maritimus]